MTISDVLNGVVPVPSSNYTRLCDVCKGGYCQTCGYARLVSKGYEVEDD